MAKEIPDLWGSEIKLDVLTPIMILNAQAETLKQKTQGVILADFFGRKKGNVLELFFDLRATTLGGPRQRILRVAHALDRVYPAVITAPILRSLSEAGKGIPSSLNPKGEAWGMSVVAETEDEFIKYIQMVLSSSSVQSTIQSLIAKSNEAKNPPITIKIEDLTGDEPEEDVEIDFSKKG